MTPEQQAIYDFLTGLERVFRSGRNIKRAEKAAWSEQAQFTLDYYFQPEPTLPEPSPDTVTLNGKFWRITQGFSAAHPAYDLVPVDGDDAITPVVAGMAVFAGEDKRTELIANPQWDRGNYVIVRPLHGGSWYYCHAEKLYVTIGDMVDVETRLGKMGNTGFTDGGKHWHVRCQQYGVDRDWVRKLGV